MPLIFIFVVGMAVAVVRRRLVMTPAEQAARGDVPARLLGWVVGLLTAERSEWGQAMVGELDRLEGRAVRWRFALGCVFAALVLPPWGRATAAVGALTVVAIIGGALDAYTQIHYRLGNNAGTWFGAVVLLLILGGYVLAGGAMLRRPGAAAPGLIGGVLVTGSWLAVGKFAFDQFVSGFWTNMWLLILAPAVVGVGGTFWGGSAAAGRRTVRLATVFAALSVYVYGVMAVAVVGARGKDPSDGWTDAQVISDRLSEQPVFYLFALPVMTVAVGWAAAAVTARLRPAALAQPVLSAGSGPMPVVEQPGAPAERSDVRARRTAWRLVLVCAAVAAVALFAFAFSRG
jgi:hypothetical protein